MKEAAEPVASDDLEVGVDRVRERSQWAGLVQGAVGAVPVEVGLVAGEDLAQVTFADDEDPISSAGTRRLSGRGCHRARPPPAGPCGGGHGGQAGALLDAGGRAAAQAGDWSVLGTQRLHADAVSATG